MRGVTVIMSARPTPPRKYRGNQNDGWIHGWNALRCGSSISFRRGIHEQDFHLPPAARFPARRHADLRIRPILGDVFSAETGATLARAC